MAGVSAKERGKRYVHFEAPSSKTQLKRKTEHAFASIGTRGGERE